MHTNPPSDIGNAATFIAEIYGQDVFNMETMRNYLPRPVYKKLLATIRKDEKLDPDIANEVAQAMMTWALEKGASHYTHWFQPLTDGTAEKHDGFIEFGEGTEVIERFSGKLLIQQEPDASSFPNGGIRNTFEARGYTAWDVSSPAFVVDTTLCIPTIFISYTGEALDYKTPLLKALAAVDKAATDVCQLFDKNITRVYTNLGWEQEYFLVDSALYNARPDLCLTGRTLMGHSSAKDQQLEDHYFGSIPPRVTAFMKELEIECHKLGIPVKTRHNEVAPNQFELAPIFENANLANDHNQLVMDLMKRIARKHHFAVLLHEKPYNGVNGSGKHNNWSLCTDTGINLFAPGKNPKGNMLFLTFLVNVLMMVYKNQNLLRASIMSAGNSHRLGANEAPPAILSIFLGKQLSSILDEIARQISSSKMTSEEKTTLKLGIGRIPEILLDTTDRNRTSPFAFTGNKFEFRMLGSSQSIASPNVVLNTIMAEELSQFADILEKADDFQSALQTLLHDTFTTHQRIIFNGNGYDDTWVQEAKRRGLANLRDTVDCMPAYIDKKNVDLFTKHAILTETEMRARYEIHLENYCKVSAIEASTLLDMVQRHILPAASAYADRLTQTAFHKENSVPALSARMEKTLAQRVTDLGEKLFDTCEALHAALSDAPAADGGIDAARYYRCEIVTRTQKAGELIGRLESLVDAKAWPYPTYADILFSV